MRRVVTGDNAQGQSVIIIDGGPSSEVGNADLGGLFEIWEDAAFGALTPSDREEHRVRNYLAGTMNRNQVELIR